MNMTVRLEDTDLLRSVHEYRQSVADKYGPLSLDSLSAFIMENTHCQAGPSKATLSNRLNALLNLGMLSGERDAKGGLLTPTLDVTPQGYAMIALKEEGNGKE